MFLYPRLENEDHYTTIIFVSPIKVLALVVYPMLIISYIQFWLLNKVFFVLCPNDISFSLNWIIVLYWRTQRKIILNGITASCLECVKFYHLNDIISFSVVNHLFFCFNFLRFLFIKIQRGKFRCFSSMKLPDFSLNNLSTFGRRRTLSSKSLTCSGDLEKCVWAHSHLQVRLVTMYLCKRTFTYQRMIPLATC